MDIKDDNISNGPPSFKADRGDPNNLSHDQITSLKFTPEEVQSRILDILYNQFLREDPLDRRDLRTGANLPEIIRSVRGVDQLRRELPNLMVCFMDKDNVSVLNDVGLRELVDYLFVKEGQIFRKHFSSGDRMVRIAGDELAYLTSSDVEGSAKIDSALGESAQVVQSALSGTKEGKEYFFGLKNKEELAQRIFEAWRLACFSKTVSSISSLYRTSHDGPKNSSNFGNWLLGKVGPTILKEWIQSKNLPMEFSSFTELSTDIKRDPAYLAHELQAFVALKITSSLSHDKVFRYQDCSPEFIDLAKHVYAGIKLFGVSGAKVAVEPKGNYEPLDIKRAMITAERIIHKNKISMRSDFSVINVSEKSPINRKVDTIEINEANGRVERLYAIKEILESNASETEKVAFKKESVSLLCSDGAFPDAFRLDRIKDLPLRMLMDLPIDKFCTSIRFSLPGFGVLNKHLRMDLADNVFAGLMDKFKGIVDLLAHNSGSTPIYIREGGGKGAVIFSSHLKITSAQRESISKLLARDLSELIDEPIKMAFHEREASRIVASRSGEFPHYRTIEYKHRGVCDVQIQVEKNRIDRNFKVAEAYKVFWPK